MTTNQTLADQIEDIISCFEKPERTTDDIYDVLGVWFIAHAERIAAALRAQPSPALVEALEKVMPISVQDGPDYASVYFADGTKHSTHAMTMNPQDWLNISAAIAAMKGEG